MIEDAGQLEHSAQESVALNQGQTVALGASARGERIAQLLEQTIYQLLPLISSRLSTPATLSETLLQSLQSSGLLQGVSLLCPAPYPEQRGWAARQSLAPQLAAFRPEPQPALLEPDGPGWPAQLPGSGRLLALPLFSHQAYAGTIVLWLRGRLRQQLSARLLKACGGLADLLIIGAEQSQLREHTQSMRVLQRSLLAISATLDMNELQSAALAMARRLFSCEQVWFVHYNEAEGIADTDGAVQPIPPSALPVIDAAIASRQACGQHSPEQPGAFAATAVIVGMRLLGVLLLQRREPFDRQALDLFDELALGIGQGLRNAQIYQDFQDTFSELHNALDQLIQTERLRALNEIARGVAHDFNNLLTIISSHTQFLYDTAKDEQFAELDRISDAITEGIETVRRLQEFTRVAVSDNLPQVILNDIVMEAYHLVEPLVQRLQTQRNAVITVQFDLQSISEISGSPPELREMVMNMIHNCLDALPTGGVIHIRTWEERNSAYLEVRDNGVGMSEDVRRRVFDPFFSTKALRGTGLGLSLVYGVIRRHGGFIDVKSIPGTGTTFTVRLPKMRGTILAED